MSTESTEAHTIKELKKEGIFSKKNRQVLKDPLDDNNPITVQVLGICSSLAVTVQMKPAIIMALGVMFVTAFSNLILSALRNTIPNRIRIIVQLIIVAMLVTIVDQLLKAYMFDVSKKLSVFVGLIITNCIVMGRLEAFAMSQKPWPSFLDGIGNGFGYGIILVIVSAIRELLGAGTLMGYKVVPQWLYDMGYVNNGLMVLPPAALLIIGCIIWWQRSRNPKLINIS
jgi:Na+-transporting NADH:ubiquinone oxidoreductase subunit D